MPIAILAMLLATMFLALFGVPNELLGRAPEALGWAFLGTTFALIALGARQRRARSALVSD